MKKRVNYSILIAAILLASAVTGDVTRGDCVKTGTELLKGPVGRRRACVRSKGFLSLGRPSYKNRAGPGFKLYSASTGEEVIEPATDLASDWFIGYSTCIARRAVRRFIAISTHVRDRR